MVATRLASSWRPPACYASGMPRRWPTKPPQIGTIGEVIRQQLSMTIYCERRSCGHHAIVDLEGIQAEHGDEFRISGFVARSRCSKCGSRHPQVTIRVSPSYAPRVIAHHRSE